VPFVATLINMSYYIISLVLLFSAGAIGVHTQMSPAKAKAAKKLFSQKCVKCHGSDGGGNTVFGQIVSATDLTDSKWQDKVDDNQIVNSITHGKGQMPSFEKKLTKDQITLLSNYVRSFRN
jgi:cytochrome c oxidase cbb3-type subunit III